LSIEEVKKMIAAPQIDYTSEARWRNETDLILMPAPEQAGATEEAGAIGDEAGPGGLPGPSEEEVGRHRRKAQRYEKARLPSYMGQHVDVYA
jgi:hypothetical protein